MAVTSTTLASPLAKNDVYALLTSPAGITTGSFLLLGNELCAIVGTPIGNQVLLRRGLDGSMVVPHAAGEPAQIGLGTDLDQPAPGTDTAYGATGGGSANATTSYAAAGAITPVPGTAILAGSAVLAMTLAAPPGTVTGQLAISSTNGVAHTVTIASGIGGGTLHTITFPAATTTVVLQALGGKWNQITLGGATAA